MKARRTFYPIIIICKCKIREYNQNSNKIQNLYIYPPYQDTDYELSYFSIFSVNWIKLNIKLFLSNYYQYRLGPRGLLVFCSNIAFSIPLKRKILIYVVSLSKWPFTISEKFKGALIVLGFISLRRLEPVGLTKNLSQNWNNLFIIFWASNSWFFLKCAYFEYKNVCK